MSSQEKTVRVTVSHQDGYALAKTAGAIDDAIRDSFRTLLHPLVCQRQTRLIMDLADSPRINSAGVANLVTLVADANTHDSRIVLCNIHPFVAGVLGVTKLDHYFEIAPTLEEAIERVKSAASR
jgi:anti-sigma B factor antagonist